MKITLSHEETSFNRATRQRDSREVFDGSAWLPSEVETALRELAPKYGLAPVQMVRLVLQYYFGDGADHFQCELCDFWRGCCMAPEHGEQTTVPLLDKGTVVVGLSASDQGV